MDAPPPRHARELARERRNVVAPIAQRPDDELDDREPVVEVHEIDAGSGEEDLDRFLHRYAGQNHFRHHLGVTYVAVDVGRVHGFATVAPRHVEIEELPERERKKLPRYPIPVLGLARLAVDESARGMGLGAQLLRFVLGLAAKMADDVGCAGVVVDAKPDAIDFYRKYGFTPFETIEGQSEARPRPTPMWLPMGAIKAAGRPAR
jgi:GNAT superfamily N-acetyltransferase